MEKYPLAPLLKVREYREDAAKNALSAAERAVVEAQEAVERCRGELERYKVWRQEDVPAVHKPQRSSKIENTSYFAVLKFSIVMFILHSPFADLLCYP